MFQAKLVRPLLGTLLASLLATAGMMPAEAAATVSWTQQAPATAPISVAYFAMSYDSARGKTVLFGGQKTGGTQSNETWEWDGANWTQMQPATSPWARNGHTMVYDSIRRVTVLFGGTYGSDTWEWDGVNWTQRISAHAPPGRTMSAMAFDSSRGKTVLFGGTAFINGSSAQLNDTWEWDGTDWTQAFPATTPVLRDEAAMAYDSVRGVTVLFGGYSPTGYRLSDTWEWNGSNWTQRTPANSPPARWGHTMVYDTVAHASVVFGGAGDAGTLGDMWLWDGSNWTPATAGGITPLARNYHAMSFDSGHGVSVLFGGYAIGSGDFADTWIARFSVAAPLTVTGTSFSGAEGTTISATLGTFSGGQGPFSGSVSWGDGSTSAATISGSSILGTHTYAEEGSYSATVTITDAGGSSATGADTGTIGDAALAVKGLSIKASRRQSFTKRVASFTDADPSGTLGDYTATVNWGDGTALQRASLSTADGVTFFVSGTHAYATKGTFTVTVRVADSGGFVANPVTTTATVGADD